MPRWEWDGNESYQSTIGWVSELDFEECMNFDVIMWGVTLFDGLRVGLRIANYLTIWGDLVVKVMFDVWGMIST